MMQPAPRICRGRFSKRGPDLFAPRACRAGETLTGHRSNLVSAARGPTSGGGRTPESQCFPRGMSRATPRQESLRAFGRRDRHHQSDSMAGRSTGRLPSSWTTRPATASLLWPGPMPACRRDVGRRRRPFSRRICFCAAGSAARNDRGSLPPGPCRRRAHVLTPAPAHRIARGVASTCDLCGPTRRRPNC